MTMKVILWLFFFFEKWSWKEKTSLEFENWCILELAFLQGIFPLITRGPVFSLQGLSLGWGRWLLTYLNGKLLSSVLSPLC
jgi:hypothetical protein